jgi:hypothetical protein
MHDYIPAIKAFFETIDYILWRAAATFALLLFLVRFFRSHRHR